MLRTKQISGFCSLTLGNLVKCEHSELNRVYVQCIRWKRKPIWLPTAKTKLFKVPERPKIPLEEYVEIQRLSNNYRTYMKSIKKYFISEFQAKELLTNEEAINKAAEEDFIKCKLINDEWNIRIAKDRDIRLAKEAEENKISILQKLIRKEERDKKISQQVTEHIKQLKQDASTFITKENLDEVIKEVLENTVNYEYAIDLNGNIYKGKYLDDVVKVEYNKTIRN